VFFCFSILFLHCLLSIAVLDFVPSVLRQETGWEERLRSDLFCVEWDVDLNQYRTLVSDSKLILLPLLLFLLLLGCSRTSPSVDITTAVFMHVRYDRNFAPRRGAKYCDQHVCLSVCLSAHMSQQVS